MDRRSQHNRSRKYCTDKEWNTDAYGFEKSLKEHGVNTDNKVILLIGAGGSAKACVYVLNNRNVKRLFIANRTKQKAVTLSKTFGGEVIMFKKIKSLAKDVDIIINCTSIDLKNEVLPYMKKQSIYYDVNYRFGIVTKRSVKMITGKLMLIFQGARSFSIWTQRPAPIEVMKRAVGGVK